MSIDVPVDETLLAQAERLTGEHDRQKLLEKALRELIGRSSASRPIDQMLDLAGNVKLRDDYDYKALRTDRNDPD